jgi:predicted regulator of Ras-like GTPase activity (Roadblock/LC7/MglB family)
LKISRELARLERRARENPSPSTFVDIAQVYINLGMDADTLRVAEEGLALFPRAEDLRKVHRFARRSILNARIKELKAVLARTPAPDQYRELAGIYLELSDMNSLQATCEECIARFPQDPGGYMVMARARLKTFYRDLTARDGLAAVRGLERVIALAPDDSAAHHLLAEVLYRVGATGPALEIMEDLSKILAGDPEVQRLLAEVSSKALVDEDIDGLFQAAEESGNLVHPSFSVPARRSPYADENLQEIREGLGQLAEMEGVRKAAYIRGSKALVKGEIKDGKDPFLRMARVIARAAQRTARRMEVGSFNRAVLEGTFGKLCLCSYGEVVAAVLCHRDAAADRILTELQDLVAGSLGVLSQKGDR